MRVSVHVVDHHGEKAVACERERIALRMPQKTSDEATSA